MEPASLKLPQGVGPVVLPPPTSYSETWLVPGGAICHGTVHYVRHDKSGLSVPFSNIFKMDGGKVREYLIFADTSELYKQ